MKNVILALESRIHLLELRDPVGNRNIVNKLKRRLRNLEKLDKKLENQ